MKLSLSIFIFCAFQLTPINADQLLPRHHNIHAKRQAASASVSSTTGAPAVPVISSSAASPAASTPAASVSTSSPAAAHPGTPTSASSAIVTSASVVSSAVSSASTTTTITTPTGPPPLATWTGVPPLASISLGMPTRVPLPAATIYQPGAVPPLSGAPVLPKALVLGSWPQADHLPPTDSPEVKEWMKELDGWNIPNLSPTVDGSCGGDPVAYANAAARGWWTCGGYTRATDIVACPDKYTWGVSFDDGPSQYTQYLLNYLDQKQIKATFFVVGSRVAERPAVLIEEYMSGHEISVHTWSHSKPLTSLSNEEIVAELGWTRKVIKDVLGVTPTTMRPPWGDIDDRVRAISLAMGMIPIMWTSSPTGGKFDTNDWRVAAGTVNGTDSFNTFESILGNATTLDTGFIVLQHDLSEITIDLAIGYTLEAALAHTPKFTLKPVGQCQKFPSGNLYLETNTNTTFPFRNQTGGGVDVSGDGTIDTKSGDGGSTAATVDGNSSSKSAGFVNVAPLMSSVGAVFACALLSLVL